MKKKETKIVVAAVLIFVIVLCLSMCHREKNPVGETLPQSTENANAEEPKPSIENPGDVPVQIEEIPGFEPDVQQNKPETPETKESGANEAETTASETKPSENETKPQAPESPTQPTVPEETKPEVIQPTAPEETQPEEVLYLSDRNLSLDALGGYSGNYLEDGTDDLINNVAAVVVTNHSGQMLQVADISFKVNDTEVAEFRITDLPAGMTVLALEQNRRPYNKEDDYSYGQTASGYMDMPNLSEDKFTIVTDTAGRLTLKNKVDQNFEKVYVYYKYVQQGGVYLGGITYRVPFENLEAGGELTEIANHFDPANSRVVDLEIAKK